jgi:hypothetical protein
MKTTRIHGFGSPDVIVIDDVPTPTPNDGEVVVRVVGAGDRPWDALIHRRPENWDSCRESDVTESDAARTTRDQCLHYHLDDLNGCWHQSCCELLARLGQWEQQFPAEFSICMEGSAIYAGRSEIIRAAAGFRRCQSFCGRCSISNAICTW